MSALQEYPDGNGPELTPEHLDVFAECCTASIPDTARDWRWFCTRAAGHPGQHEAAGSQRIAAVWG